MQKKAPDHRLILASNSPRRKQLLENVGLVFGVIPSHVDEQQIEMTVPQRLVKTLATAKAKEVSRAHPKSWVIGADTIVVIDDRVLGKPSSVEDAREMIQRLNGQSHDVFTGYAICCEKEKHCTCEVERTEVFFKQISESEIEWYLQTEEPYDKAGAYAIQEIGSFLVKRIHGSYTNVVGLPVCEIIDYLFQLGVIAPDSGNKWCTCAWPTDPEP